MSRTDHLNRATEILTDIGPRFPEAWRRWQDSRPALPGATATDGDGGGTRGPGDPTGSLATTGAQAGHDHRTAEVDDALRSLRHAVQVLDRFVAANTARTATTRDRREAERANQAEPECRPCREHADMHEPYRTITDAGGIYPVEQPLCRWHADFARRTGRPATKSETARRARGQRIMIHERGATR